MKTINNKSILILIGLILITVITILGMNRSFKEFILNEFVNFDVQALYAVSGIVVASLSIYTIVNVSINEHGKMGSKRVDYLYTRHLHHRAVIKKTA